LLAVYNEPLGECDCHSIPDASCGFCLAWAQARKALAATEEEKT
jgi:hypothetical protein